MAYTCKACGYPDLYDNYETVNDICFSCGYQLGYTDENYTYEEWRQKWISEGMIWFSQGRAQPNSWDPKRQLLNIGVKI